ncbi:MAG: metallophosphoesterase [Deferribacterota bacterium]|nr:metallophosphoesterase [Deferribacterota bacterium]
MVNNIYNKRFNRRQFLKYSLLTSTISLLPKPLKAFGFGDIFNKNYTENYVVRNDLNVTPNTTVINSKPIKLIDFAHLTDVHIVDEGNPLRFEELKLLGIDEPIFARLDSIIQTISRNQDPYSALLWDETVRSINKQHSLEPMDFLIATGDHTDTDLENELRWFIEIADGYISNDYFDRTGKKEMAYVNPIGLDRTLPWYAAIGNHDVMYQGVINNELFLGKLLGIVTSNDKNINSDTRKLIYRLSISAPEMLLNPNECIDLYKSSISLPLGHGFANMPPPNEGYYSFTPKPFIHCIVLNTANYYAKGEIPKETFSEGILDRKQFNWMISEIENNYDKLCIIFSHHPPTSWLGILSDISPKEFENTLSSYENVIVHICGHTHDNSIQAIRSNNGGYWLITTSSIIDFPQEWRRLTIYDNKDGTGSIFTRQFRHSNEEIAHIAYNDPGANHETSYGDDTDRNTELIFSMPKVVSENISKNTI